MNAATKTTYFKNSNVHAEVEQVPAAARRGRFRFFAVLNGMRLNEGGFSLECDCWDVLNDAMNAAA